MESQYYVAQSVTDTIVYGDQLREGMRVLIEDHMVRGSDKEPDNPYAVARVDECNQWCEVTGLRFRRGLATFIGKYDDGTQRVRQYASSYAWIVKLDSIPVSE